MKQPGAERSRGRSGKRGSRSLSLVEELQYGKVCKAKCNAQCVEHQTSDVPGIEEYRNKQVAKN